MLVFSRKAGESFVLPQFNVRVTVVRVSHGTVRLGVEAPRETKILRSELLMQAEICKQFADTNEPEKLSA